MARPGPDKIILCPLCSSLAACQTWMSGNTFGIRLWSDGKSIAPMLHPEPLIVKCPHCNGCYWRHDAKESGEMYRFRPDPDDKEAQINPDWIAAPRVEDPCEADYFKAIDEGFAKTPEQERILRILAWWSSNDKFRENNTASNWSLSEAGRRNLEALIALLDESEVNDLIRKAEVLRELGQFERATELLARITSEGHTGVVRQLCSFCDVADPGLKELRLS